MANWNPVSRGRKDSSADSKPFYVRLRPSMKGTPSIYQCSEITRFFWILGLSHQLNFEIGHPWHVPCFRAFPNFGKFPHPLF